MSQESDGSSNRLAAKRTDLAVLRTTLAANRSLMAWARTGLAVSGFGYTVYKILESYASRLEPDTARNIGLLLIGMGTSTIVFGCVEYWQNIREIRSVWRIDLRKFTPVSAGVFVLLSLVLFAAVVLKVI